MKTRTKWIAFAGTIVVVIVLGAFLLLGVTPNPILAEAASYLSSSNTISLLYCTYEPSELGVPELKVMADTSVQLDARDAYHLRALLSQPSFLNLSGLVSRCWNPHHVIRIKDHEGRALDIYVCFECTKIQAQGGSIRTMPPRLCRNLHDLFNTKGLKSHLKDR